jgi:hypothetical protein
VLGRFGTRFGLPLCSVSLWHPPHSGQVIFASPLSSFLQVSSRRLDRRSNFLSADPTPYFEGINTKSEAKAVGLAKELIEAVSGRFEPEKIPDKYAEALRKLLSAKIERRAPQIGVATGKAPEVINIMAVLKESMQAKGRAKIRDAVRKRMGKPPKEEEPIPRASRPRPSPRRTAH